MTIKGRYMSQSKPARRATTSMLSSILGASFLGACLFSAPLTSIAQETPEQYQLNVHIWQDNALLSAPKMIAYENETSELIVSDPDTLKLALRLHSGPAEQETIKINSQVFLPRTSNTNEVPADDPLWEEIATPKVIATPGARSSMEIDVKNRGLKHIDGRPVETLKVSVQVNTAAKKR